ncbi:MAG TPA: DUF6587 family protein [Burkholderiaceae bacterium]|nr:DUF6587 family protein [Burkholderiaceae bacterium]
MLQHLIVDLIVAAAALYSSWVLMPAGWRRKLALRFVESTGASPERARQLETALSAGGCSECSSCNGCSAPRDKSSEQQVVMIVRRPASISRT